MDNLKKIIMSLLLAAGLAAGGIIGGAISQGTANHTNIKLAKYQNEYNRQHQEREFQFNKEQSELEWQRNLAQWQRENAYNDPAAQMQRLQAAGLNPNLVYGNGSATTTAASSPRYSAAKYEAPTAQRATVNPLYRNNIDPVQMLSLESNLSLQRAQANQINAQASFTKQNTENLLTENLLKISQIEGNKISNSQKVALFDAVQQRAYADIDKTRVSTENIRLDNELKQFSRDQLQPLQREQLASSIENLRLTKDVNSFKLKMLKLGITDRDGLLTRLIGRVLVDDDSSVTDLVRNVITPSSTSNPFSKNYTPTTPRQDLESGRIKAPVKHNQARTPWSK